MQTRLTMKPGQKGTKALHAEYGGRLVCVRYKYDAEKRKRYKTVELIVEEADWLPGVKPQTVVWVKVQASELQLQKKIRGAGGIWNGQHRVWLLRYDKVVALGLVMRVVGPPAPEHP